MGMICPRSAPMSNRGNVRYQLMGLPSLPAPTDPTELPKLFNRAMKDLFRGLMLDAVIPPPPAAVPASPPPPAPPLPPPTDATATGCGDESGSGARPTDGEIACVKSDEPDCCRELNADSSLVPSEMGGTDSAACDGCDPLALKQPTRPRHRRSCE